VLLFYRALFGIKFLSVPYLCSSCRMRKCKQTGQLTRTPPPSEKFFGFIMQGTGCGTDLVRHSAPELGRRRLDSTFFPLFSSLYGSNNHLNHQPVRLTGG
jgi:hypothetical protein